MTNLHPKATLAVVLAASVLLGSTATITVPMAAATGEPDQPHCDAYDNESGWGGTDVSCDLYCGKYAALAMEAQVHDNDAAISGGIECADASGPCMPGPLPQHRCVGSSLPFVTSYEDEGSCRAVSDEWLDSGVTIKCWATPGRIHGNVTQQVCFILPILPICLPEGSPDRLQVLDVKDLCQDRLSSAETALLFNPDRYTEEVAQYVALNVASSGEFVQVFFDARSGPCEVTRGAF